nr:MarR family transcriptional regulator [uncultured Carboxylicivirga sp.]
MAFDYSKLTLVDLISEKHAQLRRKVEETWKNQSEIDLSHNEWYLLSKIEQQSITISQAASIIGMSRQAMQKIVKKLELRGFIISKFQEGNKRDKYLHLTKLGDECCQKNIEIKNELELDLRQKLGEKEVDRLKQLFIEDWNQL